jgi:serine/threonine protein kinase
MTNKVTTTQSRGIHTGKTIDGTYQIGDQLCQDSLGGLYACTNPEDDELIIKLLSGGVTVKAADAHFPLHPNILSPITVSSPGKLPRYLVLEPCVQTTLREWIKTRVHAKADNLIALMLQLTSAIHAIHESGQVLGNICPETVFIGEDFMGKLEVYLLDAEITFSARTMTQRLYQPIEQLRGTAPTVHTDIWAMGAMLYEAIYRRKPFTAKTRDELISRIETEPLGFSTFAKVSADFIRILKKCLAPNPVERYDSMTALGGDLLYLQQHSDDDVSSEKAKKAIRDSIPAVQRISVAPAKKEISRRISLFPASSGNRVQAPISQVPPSRTPLNRRQKGPSAHSALPAHGSSRLSRPPRGAAVAKRSTAPPATGKKAAKSTKSLLTWEGSIIPKTIRDAKQPVTQTSTAQSKKKVAPSPIAWPNEAVARTTPTSTKPEKRDKRKSTVAFSATAFTNPRASQNPTSPAPGDEKTASATQRAAQVFSAGEKKIATPVKKRQAGTGKATGILAKSKKKSSPADFRVGTDTNSEKSLPQPAATNKNSTDARAARVATDTPEKATMTRTTPVPTPPTPVAGRSRQQTVLGMPAVTVPIRPVRPAPPTQPEPPKPAEPPRQTSPVAPPSSSGATTSRDSWIFADDDEEKTLPVHPHVLTEVLKSEAAHTTTSPPDYFADDDEPDLPDLPNQADRINSNSLFDDISIEDIKLPVKADNDNVVLPASYLKEEGFDNPNHTYKVVTGAAPPRPTPVVPPPGTPDWGGSATTAEDQSSPEIVTTVPAWKTWGDTLHRIAAQAIAVILISARRIASYPGAGGRKLSSTARNLWQQTDAGKWRRSIAFPGATKTVRRWGESAWRRITGWGNRRQRLAAVIIALTLLCVSVGLAIAFSDSSHPKDSEQIAPSPSSGLPVAAGQPATTAPLVNEAGVAHNDFPTLKQNAQKQKKSRKTKTSSGSQKKRTAKSAVNAAPPIVSSGNKKYNRRSALYSGDDDDDDDDDAKYQRRSFDRTSKATSKDYRSAKHVKTIEKSASGKSKVKTRKKVASKPKARKKNGTVRKKVTAQKGPTKKKKKSVGKQKSRKKAPPKSGWATNPFGE